MFIRHQKYIQILRGIAVTLVVLFHLNIPGFKSGFLGVDVFFVISGYLMAVMYDPDNKTLFYLKRAKRLLPSYFVIVVATLLAALFITTLNDLKQVSSQAIFAMFFASNVGYWMENSYFDKAAFKPLLHLWSLGVEIQFYLLLPLLYWVFRRIRGSYWLLLISSGLLCFSMLSISPKTSFFWLPFRLWQFLLGFEVARFSSRNSYGEASSLRWAGAAGIATVICIPLFQVDGESQAFVYGHPGMSSLLICMATATTMYFGVPRSISENPVANVLERIGDYSYSIYLVHFPLIVMFLYRPFSGTVLKLADTAQTIILLFMIGCGSFLLYKYVERPFRSGTFSLSFSKVLAVPIAALGLSLAVPEVQSAFIPRDELAIYRAWDDRDTYRCGKLVRLLQPTSITCEITGPIVMPNRRVLLVGNSHADSLKATFAAAAYAKKVSVFFMVENNPLMPGGISPELLIRKAQSLKADAIVLHYSPGAIPSSVVNQLVGLAKENGLKISLILPVPIWNRHVPMVLWEHLKGIRDLPTQGMNDYARFNGVLISEASKIHYDKFKVYQTADVFCKPDCMLVSSAGKPLYFDAGHLTLTGSQMLRERFDRVIDDLL
jgi:peptidoglycan/LPS O-acetylase OafA/YrhL